MWDIIQFSYNVLRNPIILGLLLVIFAAIIAFWSSKRQKKQKGKKAFRLLWQSSKKLKYNDLSGRKEIKEKYPSTQAHLQGEAEKLLKAGKNILITSNSGAGKTHFTTNYLKHLDKAYVLIPNADDFDKNYDFIPTPPKKVRYKIILLDDFHTFFSTGVLRLPHFIEHAIGDGYTIWANTITGEEFEIIRDNMPLKLLSQFNELKIEAKLGKDEAKRIAKAEGIEKLPDSFTGNIGDIFQDLVVQKARYESLDVISRMLLITIKRLYMVGIYRPPFNMLKADVRNLLKFYESEISGETIISKYDDLRQKEFILKSNDPLTINFEENYLRTIVEPQLKVKDFLTNICRIFPNNVATFTQAMQAANNYEDSKKIYHSMLEKNIQPNKRPFSVLIGKADDSDIGLTWLNEMDKFQLEPDEYTLNALLRTTKNDTEKMQRVVNEMQKRELPVKQHIANMIEARKIQSNIAEYNTLMNISGSYEKALTLFHEMNQVGIKPDAISYTILIKLSGDFETGMRLFKEMNNEKIKPDPAVYSTLINISNDFNKGQELLTNMQENGVYPDIYTLNILIKLSGNFENGEALYTNMKIEGNKQNNITLRSLFGLSGDFNKKMKLFEKMKIEGLKPDTSTYAFIIYVSENFDKGMELLKQMKKESVNPDASVYGTLINLSNDFNKGKKLMDQMIEDGISPDLKALATLFYLSKDYNNGKPILDQMIKDGLKPDVRIYTKLIKLSNDPQNGWKLLDEMISLGVKPNVWTFNALIWLYKNDYQAARAILDEAMPNAKVKPDVVTYTQVMSISQNFEIASALREEMVNNGIQPNNRTLQILKALGEKEYR